MFKDTDVSTVIAGVIHRNFSPAAQAEQVAAVKRYLNWIIENPVTVEADRSLRNLRFRRDDLALVSDAMTSRVVVEAIRDIKRSFPGVPVIGRPLRHREGRDARVPEGIEGRVPYKGALRHYRRFVRITQEAPNYSRPWWRDHEGPLRI